jgi:hypothetical protein
MLATFATWSSDNQARAGAREELMKEQEQKQKELRFGRAVVPAWVMREFMLEAAKGSTADGQGEIPSDLELTLTCGGDYILIWWTNEDGSTGWDAECCNDEC